MDANNSLLRRPVRWLAGLLAVVLLAGCVPIKSDIKESDLLGSWVSTGPNGLESTLELHGDGTLTLVDVPRKVITPVTGPGTEANWGDLVSVTGEWRIGDLSGDVVPSLVVDLHSNSTYEGFANTKFYIESSGDEIIVYRFVGPSDDGVLFQFNKT